MNRLALIVFFYAGLATGALLRTPLVTGAFLRAQEAVTLTAPVVRTATNCSLDTVTIDIKNLRILATLSLNNGDTLTKQYDSFTTPTGAALLTTLNRGNFSVTSLVKAVHNRLSLDGICVGTLTGSPQ